MKQAVVVTGASTGIGYATSALLAREGFTVFAGVRAGADLQRLSALPGVAALQLDVTDAEQIRDAAHIVHESGLPLRGVVNNAGIVVPGPLQFLPIDDLRLQFEVNFFGALAVTQAFLPMLRAVIEVQTGRMVEGVATIRRYIQKNPTRAAAHALAPLGDPRRADRHRRWPPFSSNHPSRTLAR